MSDSHAMIIIAAQQANLKKEIASLEERLVASNQKLERLNITMQVLSELPGIDKEISPPKRVPVVMQAKTPRRKSGKQSVPKLILAALADAHKEGILGLEPRGLFEKISLTSSVPIRSESVGSTAWRLWKDGLLKKDRTLYMLPDFQGNDSARAPAQKNEASDQPHNPEGVQEDIFK
jgi:hypothetical protein